MTQPGALWLADWLDVRACGGDNWNAKMNAAAAELRRLQADNEAFGIHLSERMVDLTRVEAQRDALLEALRALVHEGRENYVTLDRGIGTETDAGKRWLNARAAIKAVEAVKC